MSWLYVLLFYSDFVNKKNLDQSEYNEYMEFIAAQNNRYNNEKDPELSN